LINIDIEKKLHGSDGDMNLKVTTTIKSGDFIALTGKSGSGKTTFLRILAGLEDVYGFIKVDDTLFLDKSFSLSIQKREIGFVFQDYALFENMDLIQNLLYVKNDKQLAKHLLEIVELYQLKNQKISKLSGGQKQRVALCRALMNKPKLLLMDEPFSALDVTMRVKLQQQLTSLHKEFHCTTIMVSHEPSEIYKLADRVIVLENGKIIKDGKPKDVLIKTDTKKSISFEAEILDIIKVDIAYTLVVSISQQIVKILITKDEAKRLKIGSVVKLNPYFIPLLSQ